MGIRSGVELDFSRPGKPTDNARVESFNGRLRRPGASGGAARRAASAATWLPSCTCCSNGISSGTLTMHSVVACYVLQAAVDQNEPPLYALQR